MDFLSDSGLGARGQGEKVTPHRLLLDSSLVFSVNFPLSHIGTSYHFDNIQRSKTSLMHFLKVALELFRS